MLEYQFLSNPPYHRAHTNPKVGKFPILYFFQNCSKSLQNSILLFFSFRESPALKSENFSDVGSFQFWGFQFLFVPTLRESQFLDTPTFEEFPDILYIKKLRSQKVTVNCSLHMSLGCNLLVRCVNTLRSGCWRLLCCSRC